MINSKLIVIDWQQNKDKKPINRLVTTVTVNEAKPCVTNGQTPTLQTHVHTCNAQQNYCNKTGNCTGQKYGFHIQETSKLPKVQIRQQLYPFTEVDQEFHMEIGFIMIWSIRCLPDFIAIVPQ